MNYWKLFEDLGYAVIVDNKFNIWVVQYSADAKRLRDKIFRETNYSLPESPFNKAKTDPVYHIDEKTSQISVLFDD